MTQINCKNCQNPLAKLKDKSIEIFNKRVSDIDVDFEGKKSSIKCRKCSYYSNVSMTVNELDMKKSALNLL